MEPMISMPIRSLDPQSLVARVKQRNPDVVRLAEAVSLAVHIEPELLREARLRLETGLSAAVEADLWFSPLVESRSAAGVVLAPPVAHQLRRGLAADMPRMENARELIVQAH